MSVFPIFAKHIETKYRNGQNRQNNRRSEAR